MLLLKIILIAWISICWAVAAYHSLVIEVKKSSFDIDDVWAVLFSPIGMLILIIINVCGYRLTDDGKIKRIN